MTSVNVPTLGAQMKDPVRPSIQSLERNMSIPCRKNVCAAVVETSICVWVCRQQPTHLSCPLKMAHQHQPPAVYQSVFLFD